MKAVFAAGFAGVLAGAALVVTVTRPPRSASAAAAEAVAPTAPAAVPPGWDPLFLSRLALVEAQLAARADAGAASEPTKAAATPPPAADPRAHDVEEQYRQELATLDEDRARHGREAVDPVWAPAQSASIRDELAAGEHAFHVAGVDCRDKTCVADLLYDSPADALADRGSVSAALVRGCRGISATLEPPTSAGPYHTSIIYTCR